MLWRRRSVCTFNILLNKKIEIKRILTKNFEQQLEEKETATQLVENQLFFELLKQIANYAQKVTTHINIQQLKISAHFMNVTNLQCNITGLPCSTSAGVFNLQMVGGIKLSVPVKLQPSAT